MSGFDLLPVDGGGGEPIHLPPGETVLGRGPLLGVSDKRVSRLHGLLENLNGRLRLKPTHLNPCFVQSLLSDDPRPLQRDVWFPLQDGDLFSLMPGQFIYRVVAVGGGDRTPRNSQILFLRESTPTAPSEQQEVDKRSLTKVDSAQPKEEEDKQNVISPSVTRTRVLPAWMMAAASASQSASSSYIPKGKQTLIDFFSASITASIRSALHLKRRVFLGKSKTDVPSEQPSGRLQSESNRSGISDDQSENEEKKMKNGRQQTKRADARLRTPCPYGKNCYRKNPMHFQESSHPGDTDYEEEEEDETQEEDLPECPFGTDCYRKNPLHRKEYKHTKKPARSTRTVHKKVGGGDDDDDDDDQEDEYDDSFIDDDSEDAGDDSDYKPPVSDDSGKEDIKELQKEAKTFMKTRK
ncbi:Aprataxin and PNK-like factor [Dissostichus eleginoides]|uniref:Aprataxin and PNK-like factor n=1 Tax=Dissostichus eleginoides TaxID=100907 RepID=A0AAD9BNC4_DISEL|nr:Aprataxin and PNK-like factor [Dissostichus eleginoides]